MRIGSVLASLALAPMMIAAAQPLQLEPSSPWVLDYAEDSCRLLRRFGEGQNEATIVFEKSSPRSAMSLTVMGPAVDVDDESRDITGEFRPVERSSFKDGNAAKSVSTKHDAILWTNVGFVDPAMFPEFKKMKRPDRRDLIMLMQKRDAVRQNAYQRAAQVQSIAIMPKHHRALELNTGAMRDAMKVMDQCTRDELTAWGIDPKVDDKIAIPAMPINLRSWFRDGDYPREAMVKGMETSLQFRVNVDASGRVGDCRIITLVVAQEINDKICGIIRLRARFKPAELADGTKVPDYFGNTVVFRMAN